MYRYEQYLESAAAIKDRLNGFEPDVLMVLGTGLGFLGDVVENAVYVSYTEIPHFKHSTAPSHIGRFVFGMLEGKKVCIMQGRLHGYEGYSMQDAAYPIRVAKLLGAKTMIVTNAAGSVNVDYAAGDLMLITDHIKLFDETPLRGENLAQFGPRCVDMTTAYTPALQDVARKASKETGVAMREGVYMFFPGPQFETPAEIRAARLLGGDAAGMSTVPEVIAARHCGMDILGFSMITNLGAGMNTQPLDNNHVLDTAERAKDAFSKLVLKSLALM